MFGLDHVAFVVHEASEQTKFNVLSLGSQQLGHISTKNEQMAQGEEKQAQQKIK